MRTKTIIGALALCALSLCAFGAASASASGGLTAVTCTNAPGGPGTGHFSTDHCVTPESAEGNFETVAIPNGTHVTTLNTEGSPKLTAKNIKGLNVVVSCEKSHGKGIVTNTVDEKTGEMRAHGTELVVTYSGNCKVALKANEAKTCVISSGGGNIPTNKLTSTTEAEHKVKFTPEGATPFASFTVGAGTCGISGVVVEVTGSVIGIANTTTHSHITFEEATNGLLLKANGGEAFYHGTEGGFMEEVSGEPGNTVGLTTESEFH